MTVLEELQGRCVGTSRQLRKIDGAIDCAFRAKALARQLLDLGNPWQARPEPTDIGQLLELLEAVLASVQSLNIRLVLGVVVNLPPAFIDRQFLERALLNFILNARDAMPGGHVTVAAALEFPPSSESGVPQRMIHLSVSHSGIGMDDRTLKMAGQPNFSTKTHGNGLGLATVRQIVERPGGKILDNQHAPTGQHDRRVAASNVDLFGQLKLALTGRNMAMEIRSLLTKSLSELWEFAAPGFTAHGI